MNVKSGILSAIGGTPLIELTRIFKRWPIRFLAKLEHFNPGGSTKDRPAVAIIELGLQSGVIGPQTVVIESSSGNMGIGLAQACSYHKLRFIAVVDSKTTVQNINLLKVYGATIETVDAVDPETGDYLPARLKRVRELMSLHPDSYWPNQYACEQNFRAHYATMHEICAQLDSHPDYLFCATSTCGTLRGCAEYCHNYCYSTKIIAVDAVGSVLFGGHRSKRLIPGHGAAIIPALYKDGLADDCVRMTDVDCILGCHRLLREEAVLAGGSSGAIISAVERYAPNLPQGSVCVAILPDSGERYLDTIYNSEWICDHFGNIPSLWEIPAVNHAWPV